MNQEFIFYTLVHNPEENSQLNKQVKQYILSVLYPTLNFLTFSRTDDKNWS